MNQSPSTLDVFLDRFQVGAYERQLTYAERQLDLPVRAKLIANKHLERKSVVSLGLLLAGARMVYVGPMIPRILGGALALGMGVSIARLYKKRTQMNLAVAQLQEVGLQNSGPVPDRADKLIEPHVNEFLYAERQQIKAGNHPAAVESLYRRRRKHLLYFALLAPLFLLHPWYVAALVAIWAGYHQVRQTQSKLTELRAGERDGVQLP